MSAPDERGSLTIELVILLPALLLVVWAALSVALLHHGRSAALTAAHTGARAGAALGGTEASCQAAAADLLARAGDALVRSKTTCQRGAGEVTVSVSGMTLSLVPGWAPTVSQSVAVPIERVT